MQQHLHLPFVNPYTPLPFSTVPDNSAVPWDYNTPANNSSSLPSLPASDAEAAQDLPKEKPVATSTDAERKKKKKEKRMAG